MPEPFPLVLRRLAQLDIESAAAWYEDRVKGLGVRFVEEVDFSLESIIANPEAFPIVHREIRRALLRRFPFAVFYLFRDEAVTVIACMAHASRATALATQALACEQLLSNIV